jgi:hypothetical protein
MGAASALDEQDEAENGVRRPEVPNGRFAMLDDHPDDVRMTPQRDRQELKDPTWQTRHVFQQRLDDVDRVYRAAQEGRKQ